MHCGLSWSAAAERELRNAREIQMGLLPADLAARVRGTGLDVHVKGYTRRIDQGDLQEKVYDVVWSDARSRKPDARTGKLPLVGSNVDVASATWTNTIGDPELIAVWQDPAFDPALRAFYYARVIEIPTPRWTAYDALRFGVKMDPKVPMTTQERAYTTFRVNDPL